MSAVATPLVFAAALLAGCVFGFFYTWSFTVIRGLTLADGAAAIAVMQSVNANIMTGWFAILFFGTPLATALAALATWLGDGRAAAGWLIAATAIYLVGCFAVTVVFNVPMNDSLARQDVGTLPDAGAAWTAYAAPWNAWNHVRTAACGASFLCALVALWRWPG